MFIACRDNSGFPGEIPLGSETEDGHVSIHAILQGLGLISMQEADRLLHAADDIDASPTLSSPAQLSQPLTQQTRTETGSVETPTTWSNAIYSKTASPSPLQDQFMHFPTSFSPPSALFHQDDLDALSRRNIPIPSAEHCRAATWPAPANDFLPAWPGTMAGAYDSRYAC